MSSLKKIIPYIAVLFISVGWMTALTGSVQANPVPPGDTVGVPWHGNPGITQTVAEIQARDRYASNIVNVSPMSRKPLLTLPFGDLPQNPSSPPIASWPPQIPQQNVAPKAAQRSVLSAGITSGTPQTVGVNFLGAQFSESGDAPPDSMGGVSPTQIIVCVNGRIKLFDKKGVLGAINTTTDNFFASAGIGSGTSDPRVYFDRLSGRWFITIITVDSPNKILIAVSSGANITSSSNFTFFSFQQDLVGPTPNPDTGGLGDQDTLGVDNNALYMGVDIFAGASGGFVETTAFVINKAALLSGSLVITPFRGLASTTAPGPLHPLGVDNDDPNATEGYFIGADIAQFGLLDIRRISNPGGTPSISGNLQLTVPATSFPTNSIIPLGSQAPLEVYDYRLYVAKMHNSHLWTAHTIQVDANGIASATGGRNGSRWYDIINLNKTPKLNQSGTLFDPSNTNTRHYWFATCAMSGQGHMALGCSVAGATEHAEIAVAGRLASDPLGTTRAPTVAQTSSSSYNLGFQPGFNAYRWGDYSIVQVDPADDMTMWTFQEYCNKTDSWGVRVIQLKAPPPATPQTASPSLLTPGANNVSVTITGTSTNGSGFFDPGPSYPNRLSAVINGGGITVNSVTYKDPTHITLNLSVSANAQVGPRSVTITNPDGQPATSGTGILNIGIVISGWQAVDLAVGADDKSHLLWDNADGRMAVWMVDPTFNFMSSPGFGPFTNWTAKAIAVSPEGASHILWNNVDGTMALWTVDKAFNYISSTGYGPYAGYSGQSLSVGPNYNTHVLWQRADGAIALWTVDPNGNLLGNAGYGPYPGWSAIDLSNGTDNKTRLLWVNIDGRLAVWTVDDAFNATSSNSFGPYPGFQAKSIATGLDNNTRVLWSSMDGRAFISTLDNSFNITNSQTYGPFTGFTAAAIGVGGTTTAPVTHILWNNVNTSVILGRIDAAGALTMSSPLGPY